ncbi:VanZ family protein [Flavobacterium sp.]|uniref:VanZ family protein n=1 Tax=Flavobacterium sp. TaxID=239 RepID=UPI00286AACC7|nr:VanZ family protein [Flavobacterium sp.]
MVRKIVKILIHPIFIYAVIASLECIPYESDLGKKVYHEMPKIGDNFKKKGDLGVYYYTGKGKYSYATPDCYFSFGNPSWGAKYEDGGIKTVDAEIANQIPLLGTMCDEKSKVIFVKSIATKEKIYSTNFLLNYFSGVSHLLSYLVFSLSILYHLRSQKNKYWVAFVTVFIAGGLLEFVQEFFIEGRNASFEDQNSNCLGAIIGIIVFWTLSKIKFSQKIM